MWTNTSATRRLGIRVPIIQGPFGGTFSTPELVAAVSNAGGLGSFGAQAYRKPEILGWIAKIRQQTDGAFGINLWVSDRDAEAPSATERHYAALSALLEPWFGEMGLAVPPLPRFEGDGFERQVEAVLEAKPAVFSFVFGIPSEAILQECRKRGIVTVGAATTVEEAQANEAAGVDLVVATGSDAGGHRPSFLKRAEDSLHGTFSLIPQVADRVGIPVIAAGGIADGRGVAAALRLGADAVQIGTAFLACEESGAPEAHRHALRAGTPLPTVLTRVYTGRLARFIQNRFISGMESQNAKPLPFPLQSALLSKLRAAALERGCADVAGFYAGQAAGLVKHSRAAGLLDALVREAEEYLSGPG